MSQNPQSSSKSQVLCVSPSFSSFLKSIDDHLKHTKKDPLCNETIKYRYNLPGDVRIYDLEQAKVVYEAAIAKRAESTNCKWNQEETNMMIFIVLYYVDVNAKKADFLEEQDWTFISQLLRRSSQECESKWSSLMKSRSNKKSWTSEEDQLLTSIIKANLKKSPQISWVNISQELFEKSERRIIKMARRCRERWINYLNPILKKGSWTQQEDLTLLDQYLKLNKKWSSIAESLKGRNLNSVKNRFHSLLKKHGIFEPTNEKIIELLDKVKNSESQTNDILSEQSEEEKVEESPKKKLKIEEDLTLSLPKEKQEPPKEIHYEKPVPAANPFGDYMSLFPQAHLAAAFNAPPVHPMFQGFMGGFFPNFMNQQMFFSDQMQMFSQQMRGGFEKKEEDTEKRS